jgi:ATP-binding cassette subfamily B protein/subfamily B ATP-binding cassette protein MsbA
MSIYRRAFASYRPFLRPTLVAAGINAFAILLGLLRPWPFACIVDGVLPLSTGGGPPAEQPLATMAAAGWSAGAMIFGLCGLMVVIHLASGVLNLLSGVMFLRVGLQSLLRLRTDLYACLHALPLKFHDQRRSADSSFRVAYDSQAIQTFYAKAIFLFQSSFSIVTTFILMWRLDWQLTLLSLGVVPVMWLVLMRYAKRIRAESTHIAERESAVLTVAQEGLSSIRMVQAFGREEHEVAQFRSSARQSMEANLRLNLFSMKSALIVSTLIAASTAAMYWLGSNHVLGGTLKLGELIWISSLLLLLYQPLEALTQVAWALESAAAGATRCFEVLDRQDDVPDAPDAKPLEKVRGAIVFENVSFGYDENRPILRGIDLHLDPGQTVAFVGGTGAGKSTLLSLVPRFYDPTGGRILIDGHDLRSVTKKSLRQHISMVLQDTLLFSTTIRENIAYGRPDATEQEIIEAAKRAQAHDFIMATPEGYRSQVGERGGHLSVGQRQRIGIARAFLKNAPILILDEPTSALDPRTESAILETLESLMKGRTTFIITHRIATIHGVDKIVVLGEGGIVEAGSGAELLERGGAYAALHRAATCAR